MTVSKNALQKLANDKIDTVDSYHDVPSQNSSDNIIIRDVIGNKTDNSLSAPGSDSLYGVAAYMAYYHVHSPSLIYPRDAASVVITAGVGAWTEGSKVQIVAAGVTLKAIDIHFINLGSISQVDEYVLKVYTGPALSEVFWSECSFSRDTNQMRAAYVPIQGPPIPAGTRISTTLMSGIGSNNCSAKIYTHEYP
jgi:hypothetical protein